MRSLWLKNQKPGLPREVTFIFLFRVHWWFHKNSWRNISKLTHFCLKVFPLTLGWFLLYALTRL